MTSVLLPHQGYVGGEWVDADSGATFEVVDPATQQVVAAPGIGREGSKYGIDEWLETKYLGMGGV
jgi:succinate-semialdehyde dehydrogenase/glutarate-semialdehyde dehydrogenase